MNINAVEHPVFGKMPVLRTHLPKDQKELERVANDDNHVVIRPSHVVWKEGQIAGCISMGALPLILPWLHTKLISPRDSVNMLNLVEGILRGTGHTEWCMPCVAHSPYFKYMEAFGYINCGLTTLFVKKD